MCVRDCVYNMPMRTTLTLLLLAHTHADLHTPDISQALAAVSRCLVSVRSMDDEVTKGVSLALGVGVGGRRSLCRVHLLRRRENGGCGCGCGCVRVRACVCERLRVACLIASFPVSSPSVVKETWRKYELVLAHM